MFDLIILSDRPITNSEVSAILQKEFKRLTLLANDEETLYMKKDGRGFELWFSPTDILDDPSCMMGNTVDKCPNKKAYLTNLSYTSVNVAKKIVSSIKSLFGNMWIQSDELDDWFGTAEEFIENYCK